MSANPFASGYKGPSPAAAPEPASAPVKTERQILVTKPGFFPEITPAAYFAEICPEPALTNSLIKLLAPEGAAPAKAAYHHPAIGQPPEEREETKAQYMGSLVHRLALDKGDDYVLSPYDRFQSNESKEWKANVERSGRVPVTKANLDDAQKMADIAKARIAETCQGFDYQTEVVIAWQEEVELLGGGTRTIWCRSMLDVYCEPLLLGIDLKTCAQADDAFLQKQFFNGYATQDGFYLRGLNAVTNDPGRARFGFLFVEKDEPYLHRAAASTESFRHGAKIEIERAMRVFATCLERDFWPAYEPFQAFPTQWQIAKYSEAEMTPLHIPGFEEK